jgi:hypothetical protein
MFNYTDGKKQFTDLLLGNCAHEFLHSLQERKTLDRDVELTGLAMQTASVDNCIINPLSQTECNGNWDLKS